MALVGLHLDQFYAYQPISAREARAQHGSEDDCGLHHHQVIQPWAEMPLCCGTAAAKKWRKTQVDNVAICQEICYE